MIAHMLGDRSSVPQGTLAFILATFIGPTLVSGDLSNNALPLYFSRPFSRVEYVVGKMSVLGWLLSLIMWIPGLILFLVQWSIGGSKWAGEYLWIVPAIILSSLIWICILSLLSMALSAWVKWKIAAGALMLGLMLEMITYLSFTSRYLMRLPSPSERMKSMVTSSNVVPPEACWYMSGLTTSMSFVNTMSPCSQRSDV